MPPIRRILAAVDFSPWSGEVLAAAAAFAEAYGAGIEVVHVLPLREKDVKAAEAELAAAVPAAIGKHVKSRRVLNAVAAELGILDAAKEGGADLVVVGTHGRTGLQHIKLGSVAARVVENSPVPVLTVRRAGAP